MIDLCQYCIHDMHNTSGYGLLIIIQGQGADDLAWEGGDGCSKPLTLRDRKDRESHV